MEAARHFEFSFRQPDDLSAFATALAPVLLPGDLIALHGDLGAGKSHFARAAVKARLNANGLDEEVPSPTYTLVQTYWDGNTEILHADLYRLGSPDGLDELGLFDALDAAILFVEWPNLLLAEGIVPALSVKLEQGPEGNGRRASVTASSNHIAKFLDDWPTNG